MTDIVINRNQTKIQTSKYSCRGRFKIHIFTGKVCRAAHWMYRAAQTVSRAALFFQINGQIFK